MNIEKNKNIENDIQETIEDEIPAEDKIPFNERMAFQNFLLKKMGVESGKDHEYQEKLVVNYAGKISQIIDNKKRKDNEEVRRLVMSGDYEKASEYVMSALGIKYH
jgi:hypothetical protein